MDNVSISITLFVFLATVLLITWKPRGLNETIPSSISAFILVLFGIVSLGDILAIFNIVSGASITILSTIVMTIVLESIGFFRWVAVNLINKAKGSGKRLYLYVVVLCFLMTVFFNNDGSILITTPIIIQIVKILNLKRHQQIPYLISGALVATAASAPIAISNIANLIALKIVGLTLNSYVAMMFVPSMIGIITITILLYLYFKKDIPVTLPLIEANLSGIKKDRLVPRHPFDTRPSHENVDWWMFRMCILVVVGVRASFFLLTSFGVPMEWIAIVGAIIIVTIRWIRNKTGITDVIKKTPWHILIFALSMYILVYGLGNVGITSIFVEWLKPLVTNDLFGAIFSMGIFLSVLSNLVNNLPAVMIGTITLTEMNVDLRLEQVMYLANIIGSDIGALLTPVGTLATLIWMFILKKNHIHYSWSEYFRVTIIIIPIGLVVSLFSLYLWISWLFI
ncbi:arsenite efflux membrane protein ArsB [Bacillus oleivorans]|uniref:Arsenite efflux membrane protein ArsB n=1 Tax=Bacillus oleivorans TaxID=1448271 RepID=A0A285D4L2_9BACI|nr:arsenic transporter [Bacillus oleivorans]SNX74720.1 arsenite efflux membrane protein ArsB [Bacillus oleivorans]